MGWGFFEGGGALKAAVWRPYNLGNVGSVFLIMMTLDPITPASGCRHPCPAIKKWDSRL